MYGKLILNDIRKGKMIPITIAAFITASAALTSAAAMLGVNLLGAVDHLMEEAGADHWRAAYRIMVFPRRMKRLTFCWI